MNEDIKTVYVMISEIIDSLDMRGKPGVYLNIHGIDLFDKAKNYIFNVTFNNGELTINVEE